MTKKNYVVAVRTTGTAYLTERVTKVNRYAYRWIKSSKRAATRLTRDAAKSLVSRYGGTIREA
jgi:hypothetical protein